MSRFAYLAYLVIASGGMLAVSRWRGHLDGRLLRAVLVTVPLFLIFDVVGVARGWFYTSASLNVWILPGGVSLEEVVNLAFLTILSVDLAQGFTRRRHA